jgi:transcription-repair coupling factor (superfamily II helicase)
MMASGFVAGTLVHTDKGLVPIEQLKVGDMVLSKHESGEGEQAYKSVSRAFKSIEKTLISYINYCVIDEDSKTSSVIERYLFCTENHLFWTCDDNDSIHGWTIAKSIGFLDGEFLFALHDNQMAFNLSPIGWENSVFEQDDSKIALVWSDGDDPIAIYDFNSTQPVCLGGRIYKNLHPSEAKSTQDMESDSKIRQLRKTGLSHPYLDYVYNLEVEDFHTYYVGRAGIWTHDATDIATYLRPLDY